MKLKPKHPEPLKTNILYDPPVNRELLRKLSMIRSTRAAALAIGVISISTASAEVVAGWDTFTGTGAAGPVAAPVVATGVTASFETTTEQQAWNTVDERGASSDGTWGTNVGPPAADTTVGTSNDQNLELPNATTGGTITITINGLDEPPCFVRGTRISTPQGARPVRVSGAQLCS